MEPRSSQSRALGLPKSSLGAGVSPAVPSGAPGLDLGTPGDNFGLDFEVENAPNLETKNVVAPNDTF